MWFIRFVLSSIGKKLVMATTGLLLVLFLLTHAAGNATIFMSSAVFQSYADELHSHPLIVIVFSLAILLIFVMHIAVGLYLFYENRQVSTSRYAVDVRQVKTSLASKTMPYTGLIVLLFLFVHVISFTFGAEGKPIADTVRDYLSHFFYAVFYIIGFLALGVHLSHGFWSMLQTFGVNHPRYNILISKLTLALPVFFFAIFGGIAVYFMTGLGASY